VGYADWLLKSINDPGNWGRWRPGASAANEGGVDLTLPHGTPIYALGDGPLEGWGTFTHADGSPGYGVLTQQTQVPGLGKANVYYQHIDLVPTFQACQNGHCNGQQVHRGQLIGYTRNNMYGLEVGINPKWGGVWAGSTAPGPWVTDPRPYLKALASAPGGPVTPISQGKSPIGPSGIPFFQATPKTASQNCTPPSNPLDVGGGLSYTWCQVNNTLVSFGEHIAIFVLGLALIGIGVYLLAHKQINAAVGGVVKTSAKAGEAAAL
jgi:hypothetical protein